KHWKTLHAEMVLDHRWYKVRREEVQLPDGRVLDDYYLSVRPEVAVVFPLTASGEVVMVRQYKHGAGEILLELPGGIVDDTDASPEEAARRELREETGYVSDDWTLLGTVHDDPTKNTNRFHLYLARNARRATEQALDENEEIAVETFPLAQVMQLAASGEIRTANSLATILLAQARLAFNV
ncbi:MAG: NUDIX hydrolase, partial [Cytophagales bacterium]|nr:NUDIX hydrolase [Cytophagales bacterium]